ncbi:MAG: L,D-transpeptidase family protein [Aeromicrobium sp.]
MSARDHHAIAPKAGSHRQAKRHRRAGLFAFALTLTLLVGAAGVGLLPHLHGTVPASAVDATVITSSSMETAELAIVEAPPKPKPTEVPAEKQDPAADEALPANSGAGRRVIFSESEQRVWLVNLDGTIDRTYKVSGSIHDNLSVGTYAVESHTRYATSYDYTSHMEYFVRFTSGLNAPIGFHDIPVSTSGSLVQTVQQLGTPLSSGCIRQARPDAIRLWEFAQVGTKVVVVA